MTNLKRCSLTVVLLSLLMAAVNADSPARPSAADVAFFETKVRPVLAENCYICHGDNLQSGGLKLNSREAILKGGAHGPTIVPGEPEKSLLVKAISHQDDKLKMPPQKQLSPQQIADLTRWVKIGAPWATSNPQSLTRIPQKHWAFQPVRKPPVPMVKNKWWVANPIDAFIMAKLEAKGLKPNPPATRRELIRRAYYDLIGLPPTPQEVEAFVNDMSPNAWEKLIDCLLASPRYGEKWGRHWLDLVRFAETNSYERDNLKPFAWRYRDYVIQSFNNDKPYDQFIREQLAGDELDSVTPETLIATGFYRLGLWDDEPADFLQARYDDLDDILTTTAQTFLGVTINCARCHDHKIDPVPQKDYYAMLAFFQGFKRYGVRSEESVAEASLRPIASEEERQRYETESAEYKRKLDAVNAELKEIEDRVRPDFIPVEHEEFKHEQNRIPLVKKRVPRLLSEEKFNDYVLLTKQRNELRRNPPRGLEMALCITEENHVRPTCVLIRGNPHAEGESVQPAFLSVLNPPPPVIPERSPNMQTCGRRRVLAEWIASAENPLTTRVIANRIWQYRFGRGIMRTPSDFGLQGDKPTHPELLDWLAATFVETGNSGNWEIRKLGNGATRAISQFPNFPTSYGCGWRLKKMHRLIMLSNAYKMSSRGNPQGLKVDPANDLFWRFDMRRLTAEEIRDSVLAVTGSLNLKMFGPSVYPEIPPEVLAGQSRPGYGWGKSPLEEQNRRSIYVHVKRSLLVPILESFDLAETDHTVPVRFVSTQPTQALLMLNSKFLNDQAAAFTARLKKEAGGDVRAQVRLALHLTTQRPPAAAEIQRGVKLIEDLKAKDGASDETALKYFCLMALNLNEFIYLD